MNPNMTLIVPCYNEQHRLDAAAFLESLRIDEAMQLLFVNDGSSDQTQQVLEQMSQQAGENRLRVLRLEQNQGKAEAVRQGLLRAIEQGAAFAGYIDADLAVTPQQMLSLRHVLQDQPQLLMAFGSRVKLLGSDILRRPLRHYLGRLFATVVDMMLKLGAYDTQCGAKLLRADDVRVKQALAEPFLSPWLFDVELMKRLAQQSGRPAKAVLREIPLDAWREKEGSKLRLRHFIQAPFDLLKIRRHHHARRLAP